MMPGRDKIEVPVYNTQGTFRLNVVMFSKRPSDRRIISVTVV